MSVMFRIDKTWRSLCIRQRREMTPLRYAREPGIIRTQ